MAMLGANAAIPNVGISPSLDIAGEDLVMATAENVHPMSSSIHDLELGDMLRSSMKRWVLLDSGAGRHVFNSRTHFVGMMREVQAQIITGGDVVATSSAGTVRLPLHGGDFRALNLLDVAYAPTFPCNVVSYGLLERKGAIWDTENNFLVTKKDRAKLCRIVRYGTLYALDTVRTHPETQLGQTHAVNEKGAEPKGLAQQAQLGTVAKGPVTDKLSKPS
ncbi:hypothetical protein CFIMG_007989RA00001 [Ceratocystis fimbriata CBS 114723]|uniref:Retrovirus-related Pol polyprotein from transposon TNT 1-94-like beta-barrel domain-containing protein n=1 Tax=Ceratocystis fimbriata CBS 114723 TaxID=1035309 RepID=A0A2C5WPP0_9PEZI|nr:hypothetical protein CFIMG_007989RA00001 [Ceratocystis fimbriata CBS 114723]